MQELLEFLKGFNVQTLIGVAAIVWYFSRHLDSKFDKLENKIDQQSKRTDRLYEMFIDLINK